MSSIISLRFFPLDDSVSEASACPEIAARLPELMGYWLMCLCIDAMVARRTSRLFGVVACFSAVSLLPYVYSFEARLYGLMDGLCALAFHGWMLIGEGERNIFRAVSDGTVERVQRHFSIPFGFGGLTLPERGNPIPCRLLIGEMIRLSCNFSFLRRPFFRDTGGENLLHTSAGFTRRFGQPLGARAKRSNGARLRLTRHRWLGGLGIPATRRRHGFRPSRRVGGPLRGESGSALRTQPPADRIFRARESSGP